MNTRKFGCCPKAGTFFKFRNPLKDVLTYVKERIESFFDISQGQALPELTTLQNILATIQEIIDTIERGQRKKLRRNKRKGQTRKQRNLKGLGIRTNIL